MSDVIAPPARPDTWIRTPLAERTAVHVIERGAGTCPERLALVDSDEKLTYRQAADAARRVGRALTSRGVRPGDRVVLMMDNSVDHVIAWLGCVFAGAVSVPVNVALMPPQISFIVEDSDAALAIVDDRYVDRFRTAVSSVSRTIDVVTRRPAREGMAVEEDEFRAMRSWQGTEDLSPPHAWDLASIMYTSGTTGNPKGVLVSHAQTFGRMLPLGLGSPQEADVCLVVLPIYHVIGQCRGMYNTLIARGTVVLERRFSASRFWQTCRRHRVTFVPLVGVMADYLLQQPPRVTDREHSVRGICLGTTTRDASEFAERFGVSELFVSYGLTEAGGVLVGEAESEGCGHLRGDFEARLVDAHDVQVADGEVGELVLRGREPWSVMFGYHRQPELTQEKLRNQWLHTGDLMYQREDGVFVFVGRMSDRIRHKGENVSPVEVEARILEHPAVADCAVLGVATEGASAAVGEQDILSCLVLRPGQELDPRDLVDWLGTQLPKFAVPRYVRMVDVLPRTDSTHRVQKQVLADFGVNDAWDALAPPSGSPS